MASNFKLSNAAKNARMNSLNTSLANGKLRFTMVRNPPVRIPLLVPQNLLAEFTLPATFGTVANGVLTANAITQTTGAAAASTGKTATWFRMTQSDGTTALADGTVGQTASDINIDNPSIAQGQTVKVNSLVLTDAN